MRRAALLLVLLTLAFAPAPLPRPERKADDSKKLQGRWVLLSRLYGGRQTSHVVAAVEIEGDRWTYVSAKGDWRASGKMILDTSTSPRRLDWGPGQHRGVYELRGDRLVFVFTTGASRDEVRDLDGDKPGRYREEFRRAGR
jgi:uncharacterized protein (TIGR03067 family)